MKWVRIRRTSNGRKIRLTRQIRKKLSASSLCFRFTLQHYTPLFTSSRWSKYMAGRESNCAYRVITLTIFWINNHLCSRFCKLKWAEVLLSAQLMLTNTENWKLFRVALYSNTNPSGILKPRLNFHKSTSAWTQLRQQAPRAALAAVRSANDVKIKVPFVDLPLTNICSEFHPAARRDVCSCK